MPQCAFDDSADDETGKPLYEDFKNDDRTKS